MWRRRSTVLPRRLAGLEQWWDHVLGTGVVLAVAVAVAPASAEDTVCVGVVQFRQELERLELEPAPALGVSPLEPGLAPHPQLCPALFLSTWLLPDP